MEDQTERKLSRIARRKLSQAAKRTAKKRATKKKLFAKRMKSPAKLKISSEKVAKNLIVKKMTGGKAYGSLSVGQKEKIDKQLATKKGLIAKVAKKLLPRVKKKEKERIKKIRASSKDVDESIEEKHGVLTLSVNGSQPEVSARYVNGNLKPYTFKTRENAKLHCKKVGGKPFESISTGRFYVEFTKLDGPIDEKVEYKNANEMNENKQNEEDVKDLKAMLDIAKLLSDKSPYFKGRGSRKEYIKMLVHKIRKLSESKKHKLMTKLDAYKKIRKQTLPKSRPMKSKKSYDRKDFKKGNYDLGS